MLAVRFSIFLAVFLTLCCSSLSANNCQEKIVIDSIEYAVGPIWCGKKLDTSDVVDINRISRIPDEYCFEDFHIYIDVDTRNAFVKMAESAKSDSIALIVKSGYRSKRYQSEIISRRLAEGYSFETIIKYVAPPGYSEHETGKAIDLVANDTTFAFSKVYSWLKMNAYDFGFIESLPQDSNSTMPWEPWHWFYKPDTDEVNLSPSTGEK